MLRTEAVAFNSCCAVVRPPGVVWTSAWYGSRPRRAGEQGAVVERRLRSGGDPDTIP